MPDRRTIPSGLSIHDWCGAAMVRLGSARRVGWRIVTDDVLTGLPSRHAFEAAVERSTHRIHHGDTSGCIAMFDLDDFEGFNDRHGRQAGDHVLRQIAERMRGSLRAGDVAARLAGDEFVLLLPTTSTDEAQTVVERLLAVIATIPVPGGPPLTASAGMISTGDGSLSTAALLDAVTEAFTFAKANHPGEVILGRPGMRAELRRERRALAKHARYDARTDLRNSRTFEGDLERLHATAQANGATYGLIIADIDHFHEYNRTHGMLEGNDTLRAVADALTAAVPEGVAYRYGGEEFTVLLPHTHEQAGIDDAGHRMVDGLRELGLPHDSRPEPPPIVTITAAGALVRAAAHDATTAIETVDRTLRFAKQTGRDRYLSAANVPEHARGTDIPVPPRR